MVAVTRTRTILGDRSFAVAGPHVWNNLLATHYKTDHQLQTIEATSENTFIQGLEIAVHCDS